MFHAAVYTVLLFLYFWCVNQFNYFTYEPKICTQTFLSLLKMSTYVHTVTVLNIFFKIYFIFLKRKITGFKHHNINTLKKA